MLHDACHGVSMVCASMRFEGIVRIRLRAVYVHTKKPSLKCCVAGVLTFGRGPHPARPHYNMFALSWALSRG